MPKLTPVLNSASASLDNTDWAPRSDYWQSYRSAKRGAPKKFIYREPLILCGHAAHIRVDHGSLLIRNGFTHYPQKQEIIRLFPGDSKLPDRIVMLDGSGGLSFDALNWMSEQSIEFVRLDWQGEITNVAGRSGYAGNAKLIEAQNKLRGTQLEIDIFRYLISEKLDASFETLKSAIPQSAKRVSAIARLIKARYEIGDSKRRLNMNVILGMEGACASAYFEAWHNLPVNWSGFNKKPIPEHWFKIVPRQMGWLWHPTNARHPVNAMLNYGYGILANEVRSIVIAAGLDPTVGMFHRKVRNKIPLVYDLMEPLRPVVDRAILKFALSHTFMPGDFVINRSGACRLNPQMVKVVAKQIIGISDKRVIAEYLRRIVQGH